MPASSRTCVLGRRPWALSRRAPSIPVRCRAGAARMVDARSRLEEVYAHPVGRDAIDKVLLQLGRSRGWVGNPVVANLRLGTVARLRSEEHTSEFQSRGHLVCRLLLEKKNSCTTPAPRGSRRWARATRS